MPEYIWYPHEGPQQEFCEAWETEVLYGGAAGGGKLLALDTPLATPHGWTTMAEVQVGDEVFSDDGSPCKVIVTSPIQTEDTYRLTFSDGSTIIAGARHRWVTQTASERMTVLKQSEEWRARRRESRLSKITGNKSAAFTRAITERNKLHPTPCTGLTSGIRTTEEIAKSLRIRKNGRINHSINVADPLTLEKREFIIEPYVLGAWLGDGTSMGGSITGVDEEVFLNVANAGYTISRYSDPITRGIPGLKTQLKQIGVLGNKHIPIAYLRGSLDQRLALLQGLMDTDGYCDPRGQCTFTTTKTQLKDSVLELIISLGIKAAATESRAKLYGRDCGPSWDIKFLTHLPAFRLPRKLIRQKRDAFRGTHEKRYIVDAQKIDPVPMRCIAIDAPSHLYVAGKSMIPTHNTDCLINEATRFINFKEYHGLLIRRTFPMLQEVIDRTRRYYPYLKGEYRASEHRWYFPSGAKIDLGHCQHDGDEYNYQGKEYQFIGLDEAGQFLPKQILYLFSRCRSTNPEIPKRMRYASNPGGPAHQFLKDRFRIGMYPLGRETFRDETITELIPGQKIHQIISRVFIPAKLADNPSLAQNDPNYVAMLMQLPEIERMRLLEGIWDAFEGQCFPEINYELHSFDIAPEDIPPEWTRYRTFDWGRSAPFSVGWWAVDYDDNLYRYREWYGAKKDDVRSAWVGLKMNSSDIARGILEREEYERTHGIKINPGPADPSIWHKRRDMKTGAIGPAVADEMIDEGVVWIPADNDRILGKQQLHSRLAPDDKGIPKIFISKECTHWWRTMTVLTEDPRNPEDVDTRSEDHQYDESRYMAMFRPLRPVAKPRQDVGSFQSERRRYIKAKQFATRFGVGMSDAYRRVR